MQVQLSVEVPAAVPERLANGICRLAREGIVNAARHGQATKVELGISAHGSTLSVHLRDNGRSFRFLGSYDHDALVAQRLGPVGLKERVIELGGTLAIRSAEDGATLDIRIPLPSHVT